MSAEEYSRLRTVCQAVITILDSLRADPPYKERRPWAWEGSKEEVEKVINDMLDAIEGEFPKIYPEVESKLSGWLELSVPDYLERIISTTKIGNSKDFYEFMLMEYMTTPTIEKNVSIMNTVFGMFADNFNLEDVKTNPDVQKALVEGLFSIEDSYENPRLEDLEETLIKINWGPEVLIQSDGVQLNYQDKVKINIKHEDFMKYLKPVVPEDLYKKVEKFITPEIMVIEYTPERMLEMARMADEVGEVHIPIEYLPSKVAQGANSARSMLAVATEGKRQDDELYDCIPGIDSTKYKLKIVGNSETETGELIITSLKKSTKKQASIPTVSLGEVPGTNAVEVFKETYQSLTGTEFPSS